MGMAESEGVKGKFGNKQQRADAGACSWKVWNGTESLYDKGKLYETVNDGHEQRTKYVHSSDELEL